MLASGSAAPLADRRLGRDRVTRLTAAVLLLVAALAWVVLVLQVVGMGAAPMAEPGMAAEGAGSWIAGAAVFLAAWGVMMAAMMLPSATPMIALYGAIRRGAAPTAERGAPTVLFALVYLVVWLAFGVPVYLVGLALGALAESSSTVAALVPRGVALVLLAAGVYQFSSLKRACLRVCRSPLAFLLGHWRARGRGTLRLALLHAAYCVGCCWALMAVLVAAGAMGIAWVLLIAAFVAAEKLLPGGERVARAGGVALVVLGLLVAVQPEVAIQLRGATM